MFLTRHAPPRLGGKCQRSRRTVAHAIMAAFSVGGRELLQARGAQLTTALKTLGTEMGTFEQSSDDGIEFPEELAAALANNKMLKHRDDDVRLLVACCLSDLLRIYAPHSPFDSPELLKDVFGLLVEQLQGVGDVKAATYPRYVYLIERLAAVHSFVLMLELTDSDKFEEGAKTVAKVH